MKNTHPKKFALIGLLGSGKSTFAPKLDKILDIPVHHLDRHMFEPGGKKKEKRARIEELRDKYPQTDFLIFRNQKDADLFIEDIC